MRLRRLAVEPKAAGRYDVATDRWSAGFDDGNGQSSYVVNDDNRRIVVLSLIHLS